MNSLSLDATDPDMRDACGDTAVGDERTFTVTGKLTQKNDRNYVFKLSDVQYDDAPDAEAPPKNKPAPEDMMTEQPVRPAAVNALMS